MRLPTSFPLLHFFIPLFCFPILSAADTTSATPPLYTTHLFSLRPSPNPSPNDALPLATLFYNPQHPHLSRIESFTPPPNTTDLTSILVFPPSDGENPKRRKGDKYTSSLTATRGFHAPYTGRFSIHVSLSGEVLGAWYRSFTPDTPSSSSGNNGNDKGHHGHGDFDMTIQQQAPRVFLDKTSNKGAAAGQGALSQGQAGQGDEGEGGEVQEKTFFQK